MGTNLQGLPEVTSLLDVDILHIRIIATGKDKRITLENLRNVIGSLPQTVDLTSADVTVTLSEITGALQTKSIYWTDGGTYSGVLAVTDGAKVGGLAASIWTMEGEGHMLLESDGSNWQVREYEDSGSVADGNWFKTSAGRKELIYKDPTTRVTNGAQGSIWALNINYTYGTSFVSVDIIIQSVFSVSTGRTWGGPLGAVTTTDFIFQLLGATNTSDGKPNYTVIGRWRT